jgi:hypothetical protein
MDKRVAEGRVRSREVDGSAREEGKSLQRSGYDTFNTPSTGEYSLGRFSGKTWSSEIAKKRKDGSSPFLEGSPVSRRFATNDWIMSLTAAESSSALPITKT